MRDKRFKAVHRGGPLDIHRHRLLAAWAADCAEHVLPLFSGKYPHDHRPQQAIETARSWACGQVTVDEARTAALKAHSAARATVDNAASAAARAAAHSVATAHMADHAPQAAAFAVRAVQAASSERDDSITTDRERKWQQRRLPADIRALIEPDSLPSAHG